MNLPSRPALEVKNLTYDYAGTRALHDVSFAISPGSVTALVGPNGAGKTTIMRCLSALETPFRGTVSVFGTLTHENPRLCHQKLGYLSDSFGLYEKLTIKQSLIYSAKLHQLSAPQIETRINEVASSLDLRDRLSQLVGGLSRGFKQRVGIAQALIHKPQLLILDEPAAGLDPEARQSLSTLLRTLASTGMTILVSSHILSELQDYSESMLILKQGRIVSQTDIESDENAVFVTTVLKDVSRAIDALTVYPSISDVAINGAEIHFTYKGSEADQAALLSHLITQGIQVTRFFIKPHNLNELYLEKIQRDYHER